VSRLADQRSLTSKQAFKRLDFALPATAVLLEQKPCSAEEDHCRRRHRFLRMAQGDALQQSQFRTSQEVQGRLV
jgi:hypothetical protein